MMGRKEMTGNVAMMVRVEGVDAQSK